MDIMPLPMVGQNAHEKQYGLLNKCVDVISNNLVWWSTFHSMLHWKQVSAL